jgi:hypothetical protein
LLHVVPRQREQLQPFPERLKPVPQEEACGRPRGCLSSSKAG